MSVTLGRPHSASGVAILTYREVCNCPRCREFVLIRRGSDEIGDPRVADPTIAEWLTIRLMYPAEAARDGCLTGGRLHDCRALSCEGV